MTPPLPAEVDAVLYDGEIVELVDFIELISEEGSKRDGDVHALMKGGGHALGDDKNRQGVAVDECYREAGDEAYVVIEPMTKSMTGPADSAFIQVLRSKDLVAAPGTRAKGFVRARTVAFGDGRQFKTRHEELEWSVDLRRQRSAHAHRLFRQAAEIVDRTKERKLALERTHYACGFSGALPEAGWLAGLNGTEDGLGSIPELCRSARQLAADSGGEMASERLRDIGGAATIQAVSELQATLSRFGWEAPKVLCTAPSEFAKRPDGRPLSKERLLWPGGGFPAAPDLEKLSQALWLAVHSRSD
eukprot:TRINITY_DN28987_c0_g1_i3.p1 TRINITY_DN28987_c0_g1~~TRINITY_DN28987_c0_g1_i3.p1  ORF type:complete len:303 (-),score=50.95 TRINITY_DN28987_c0_g1_i3:281-1189(-)